MENINTTTAQEPDEAITKIQISFILKAINNYQTLYDFENTTNKEFKDTYGISKNNLKKELNNLRERF